MNEELEEIARKPGALELLQALQDVAAKIERRPRLVGAIADPTTTHEAFYSMLFGEVSELVHQLTELEKTLPELNRDLMVSAMGGIAAQLDPVFGQVEDNIKSQLQSTLELVEKVEARFGQTIARFELKSHVLTGLNLEQLTLDVRNSMTERAQAAEAMQKASSTFNAAAKRLDAAAVRVESGRAARMVALVTAIVFAGLVGGFVGGYVFSFASQTAPAQLLRR